MNDRDTINFSEDHELNTVLENVGARATEANRALVKKIGDEYKKAKKVKVVADRKDFYAYIREHDSFGKLEVKAMGKKAKDKDCGCDDKGCCATHTLRPLDDRIVVKRLEAEEKTAGGIILPDAAKEKPQKGKVVAVGSGKLLDSGVRATPDVVVGDIVLFGKYSGTEVKVDGQEFLIMREGDLLAKC